MEFPVLLLPPDIVSRGTEWNHQWAHEDLALTHKYAFRDIQKTERVPAYILPVLRIPWGLSALVPGSSAGVAGFHLFQVL